MAYDDIKNWHKHELLQHVKSQLEKRDFEAVLLENADAVQGFIHDRIAPGATVGLGGSVSIRELSIDNILRERGNTVYDTWCPGLSFEEAVALRKKHQSADVFISSANAVTMNGQLVNIDGVGNRVAAMIFGPGYVISFVGINKIVKDVDEAIWRIKNIATPMNCKKLGIESPCAKSGRCMECRNSSAVCRITTILDYRPSLTRFTVVLLPMELGF